MGHIQISLLLLENQRFSDDFREDRSSIIRLKSRNIRSEMWTRTLKNHQDWIDILANFLKKNKYICWMAWRCTCYLDFRIINYFNHFLSYAKCITFYSCKLIFELLSIVIGILRDKKRFKVTYDDWIRRPYGDSSASIKQIMSKSFM